MIYATGDSHGNFQRFAPEHFPGQAGMTKEDYMLICGDFGGVWSEKTLEEDLDRFSALPFTVLFVDGNHENFDLLSSCPVGQWQGGKVHFVREDVIHLMRGQVYELEGHTFFTFGGATSLDRAFRTEGESWWRQELPTYEELEEGLRNFKRCGRADYVVTHSCGERAYMPLASRGLIGGPRMYPETHLLSNFEDLPFGHWFFGHYHVDARLGEKYTALLHEIVRIV